MNEPCVNAFAQKFTNIYRNFAISTGLSITITNVLNAMIMIALTAARSSSLIRAKERLCFAALLDVNNGSGVGELVRRRNI